MTDIIQPLITIAIPTFNRAGSYLKQTIQSALSQTYSNIEIIVADNASTDNTETVVKRVNDPRIRYFRHSKGVGYIGNANFCAEQARGEYLLLLHDDDKIDHDFIDACLKAVNYATDIGIIRTGTRWIDPDGNLLRELPNEACGLSLDAFFRAHVAGKSGTYLCSTLFNTRRLREMGGFHSAHNLLEDVMAMIKLASEYGRQDIYEIKASNRKHPSEMTFSASIYGWCQDSIDLIDLMCDLSPENKALVRAEGRRQMSSFNYTLASKIKSPIKRFVSYIIVFKKYNYRYLPPFVTHIIYKILIYSGIRYIKRKAKQLLTSGTD